MSETPLQAGAVAGEAAAYSQGEALSTGAGVGRP